MKKNSIWFLVGVGVVSLVLILFNFDNENFFDATLLQILTLAITAILSFYFVQLWTDKRRKIDCFERVLSEIQEKICHDNVIFSRHREALLIQSSIAKKIDYLCTHSFEATKEDLAYIKDKFTELRELYGEHQSSDESLAVIQADIARYQYNLSDKCEKIRISLYDL